MSVETLIAPRGFRHLPRHDVVACLQALPAAFHTWTRGDLEGIGKLKVASILGPSDNSNG
jgi:hypothetical protein